MKSILFLTDTFNRRFMKLYQESGIRLPNIERLADRSAVFENHFTASAPCMPARRDIMTGRVNFLERNWGPVEPFDNTLPEELRKHGISSRIVTDHYHYFEIGGENYCQMFDSWELVRGQEWDPIESRIRKTAIPDHLGKIVPQYWYNRAEFAEKEDQYPSAVTVRKAASWLDENHDLDQFFLWVEPFDPHEPFDVPKEYLDAVGDTYEGLLYMWPEYKKVDVDQEALTHIRKRYLALMLMVDAQLGTLLDVMDRYDMWKDTCFIFTTDHGYMLGEHGYMAKNYMPAFNEVFHIPLIVHLPGGEQAGRRIGALTQNIDLMPTLLDLYGIDPESCRNRMHGSSWLPLIRGEQEKIRDYALFGYFGKQINLTDGTYTYFRSPSPDNRPLNLYTAMPTDIRVYFNEDRISDFSRIEAGPFLSWTDYPVYRIPADVVKDNDDGTLRYVWLYDWEQVDQLYQIKDDYEQRVNLITAEPDQVCRMAEAMKVLMNQLDAPPEQFTRMRF